MNKIWYAAMRDKEDNDWGYGSYSLEEAKEMARNMESEESYIAVIEEGNDPICIEEIPHDEIME